MKEREREREREREKERKNENRRTRGNGTLKQQARLAIPQLLGPRGGRRKTTREGRPGIGERGQREREKERLRVGSKTPGRDVSHEV